MRLAHKLEKDIKMITQISENQQYILNTIVPLIAEKLGVDSSEVLMGSHFVNDLGADSLDTVELFMEFDKAFDISIPDDEQEHLHTVGDTVRMIENILENGVSPAKTSTNTTIKKEKNSRGTNVKTGAQKTKATGSNNKKTPTSRNLPHTGARRTKQMKDTPAEVIFSGNILNMTVEQALENPAFNRTVGYVLQQIGGTDALKMPLSDVIRNYLELAMQPKK